MFDDNIRLKATLYIWGALTLIMLGLLYTVWMLGEFSVGHIIVAIFLALSATGSTIAMWVSGEESSTNASVAKDKSGDRINRLLDKLSEDDLERLRERLLDERSDFGLGQDGELVRLRK